MEMSVFLLDGDAAFSDAVSASFTAQGIGIRCFASREDFLDVLRERRPACIILALELEGASGLDLQDYLCTHGYCIPLVFVARRADAASVVQAMRGGAYDFLQKPVDLEALADQVLAAVERGRNLADCDQQRLRIQQRVATLTDRENEVLTLALSGKSNKEISGLLRISPRTVETHRAHIMEKLGINNLLELAHVFAAIGSYITDNLRDARDGDPVEHP